MYINIILIILIYLNILNLYLVYKIYSSHFENIDNGYKEEVFKSSDKVNNKYKNFDVRIKDIINYLDSSVEGTNSPKKAINEKALDEHVSSSTDNLLYDVSPDIYSDLEFSSDTGVEIITPEYEKFIDDNINKTIKRKG